MLGIGGGASDANFTDAGRLVDGGLAVAIPARPLIWDALSTAPCLTCTAGDDIVDGC